MASAAAHLHHRSCEKATEFDPVAWIAHPNVGSAFATPGLRRDSLHIS